MALNEDANLLERIRAVEQAIDLLSRLAVEKHDDVFSKHITGFIMKEYSSTENKDVKAHYARLANLMNIDFQK